MNTGNYAYLIVTGTILCFASTQVAMAEESADDSSTKSTKEKKFRVVPLVSSNPTSGTGAGLVSSYIYKLDPESAPSQWMTGGQYTNTKSWSVFSFNNAYLKEDTWRSVTALFYSHNKSQFTVDFSEIGLDIDFDQYPNLGDDVRFSVDVAFIGQKLLYKIKDDFYVGGHAAYISQQYSDPNELGALFIKENGIENSSRGTLGIDLTYDTRNIDARFYPHDANWFAFSGSTFPAAFGSDETYDSALLDLRTYRPGVSQGDVWANQLYGKYVSESAPDGGLAALGARNVLRGFPMGKYKARYLTAFQSEYRYQFVGTKYRAVAFAGIASLSGGSQGSGSGNRDEDNGLYYSGGFGLRYAIQQKTGVDLRLDIVTTSDNEQSVYIGLNQAF